MLKKGEEKGVNLTAATVMKTFTLPVPTVTNCMSFSFTPAERKMLSA